MYLITLLRHGESEGNASGVIQGRSDLPLTENGVEQTQNLAQAWKSEGIWFHQIVSSPLKRARQTAEAIAAVLEIPVEFNQVWMERAFGELEGKTLEEVQGQDPSIDFYDPYRLPAIGAETALDLFIRASQGLQDVLRRPEGSYLVVSHGAILNMALYSALGLSLQNGSSPRFSLGNTGFANLLYEPAHRQWWLLGLYNPSLIVITKEQWESVKDAA
jgi:broad specificity phosphatase PhoE